LVLMQRAMIVEDESMPRGLTRPPIDTAGETSTVESDAVPRSALLMRKWIGERGDRLMQSKPFAITFQVSRNLSLARGQ
jgi:hypothetical protein